MITIEKGTLKDLDQLAPLFDGYRVFYNQATDLAGARAFLHEMLEKEASVVFLAYMDAQAVGFTQLFHSFSSVSMRPIFILNDLFVMPEHRGKGIGEALLERAKSFCIERGCKGLALETATDNPAQELYERMGWEKDTHCFHYFWTVPGS